MDNKSLQEKIFEELEKQIRHTKTPQFIPETLEIDIEEPDLEIPDELFTEEFLLDPEAIDRQRELMDDLDAMKERDFYDNFVDDIEETARREIALDLIQRVESDMESRKPWEEALVSTLKTIGVNPNLERSNNSNLPFEGASQCEFPMLSKAMIQFQARAIAEILPDNPAKTVIIGDQNLMREEQARRVEAMINYQLDYLDQGFFNDYRKMLMYLPLAGSTFRKVYHDPIITQNISRFVKPEDFIIHYDQVSLESTNRYTHRMYMNSNELRKMQYLGHFSNVDIGEAELEYDRNIIREQVEDEDGYDPGQASRADDDLFHTIYEIHCDLDIAGFEHVGNDGEATGIELPYIVTIHKQSAKILSIRRNWKEDDANMRKRVWFIHYQFLPGLGFYGFGYAHVIGSIARASTSLLRAILDGTALHLLKGGFKTADAKIDGDQCLAPGEFRSVETTVEDLKKAFYPLEYAAPSPQVIQIIQFMDKIATDVVSTTEVMVGSANNNGPVGTTLALIEQSQKVYTSIHKALHRSFGQELRLIADLNFEYLPDQFNFASKEGTHFVYRSDFDGSVGIIPVSDPNISSFQQRQAIDQATLQLALQFPQYFKMEKVVRRIMSNLGVSAIDDIMFTEQELQEQAAIEQQQMEQTPPPPNPIEEKIALQDRKIQGDMALQDQKFEQDKELQHQEFLQNRELEKIQQENDVIMKSGGMGLNPNVITNILAGIANNV